VSDKKKKETFCRNGCGIKIHFDNNERSKSGKMIPLEENDEHHDCPNSTLERKPILCLYGCGTEIHFDDDWISENGKLIPLEGKGEPHECSKNPKSKSYGKGYGR
jgi:hypothetical protein